VRTKKLQIVLETGELGHGVPLTIHCALVLHEDGTITGGGVIEAPGLEESFAATGSFIESIGAADQSRAAGTRR
jgi:hypothetical protein